MFSGGHANTDVFFKLLRAALGEEDDPKLGST
jgi:hypothetical protein